MQQGPPAPDRPSGKAPDKPTLFLDKEGRWFHEGVEITHERTLLLFRRNLQRNQDGTYVLRIGLECAEVEVEDTPYTVKSVTVRGGDGGVPIGYLLHLNDGTVEALAPETLTVTPDNVLYCTVKDSDARARFLRPAYYQLCAHLSGDAEREDVFWLPVGNRKVRISTVPDTGSTAS